MDRHLKYHNEKRKLVKQFIKLFHAYKYFYHDNDENEIYCNKNDNELEYLLKQGIPKEEIYNFFIEAFKRERLMPVDRLRPVKIIIKYIDFSDHNTPQNVLDCGLHLATEFGDTEFFNKTENIIFIKNLLANYNFSEDTLSSNLHIACRNKNIEIVKLLFKYYVKHGNPVLNINFFSLEINCIMNKEICEFLIVNSDIKQVLKEQDFISKTGNYQLLKLLAYHDLFYPEKCWKKIEGLQPNPYQILTRKKKLFFQSFKEKLTTPTPGMASEISLSEYRGTFSQIILYENQLLRVIIKNVLSKIKSESQQIGDDVVSKICDYLTDDECDNIGRKKLSAIEKINQLIHNEDSKHWFYKNSKKKEGLTYCRALFFRNPGGNSNELVKLAKLTYPEINDNNANRVEQAINRFNRAQERLEQPLIKATKYCVEKFFQQADKAKDCLEATPALVYEC